MNKRKVNAAITAGLCLTMTFGAMPTAAIAEGLNETVPAAEGQQPESKLVSVDCNGMTIQFAKGTRFGDVKGQIAAHFDNATASTTFRIKGGEVLTDDYILETDITVEPVAEQQPEAKTIAVTYVDSMSWNGESYDRSFTQDATADSWNIAKPGTWGHDGYEFAGWSYNSDGSTPVPDDFIENLLSNGATSATVYAQWTKAEEPVSNLNITYRDPMDDTYAWTQYGVPADDWFFNPQANGAMQHPGYKFVGWSKDAQNGEIIDPAEVLTSTGDLTLYAQWQEEDSKTNITYIDPMGDYTWKQTIENGQGWYFDLAEDIVSHEGYTFAGWSLDAKGGEILNPQEALTLIGDVCLYAQWTPVEESSHLNIFFRDAMDDSYLWEWAGAPADAWYFDPEANGALSHEGYTFAGWTYDKEGQQPVAANDLATTTGDVTLYAQWKPADEGSHLNVFYRDAMDDSYLWVWTGAPQDNWYFDPSANGAIEHEGYEFAGWTYDKEGQQPVEKDALLTTTGDVTVYAQWTKVEEPATDVHTVTFKDLFNKTVNKVEVKDGEAVATPNAPSFDGYTFHGWSTSDTEYVEYDFATPVTEDITLYASYAKNADPVVPGEDVKPEENGKDDQATSDPQPSLHAGETEDEAKADEQDEKALPQTSDSTPVAAVAGISVAGIIAAVAGFLMKRRTN